MCINSHRREIFRSLHSRCQRHKEDAMKRWKVFAPLVLVVLCVCMLMIFSTTATTTAAATIPGPVFGLDDVVISATTSDTITTAIARTFDPMTTLTATTQTSANMCMIRPAAQSQKTYTGTNAATMARRSILKLPL